MAKYRKKPVVIEATRWFKNGDHPMDFHSDTTDPFSGRVYSGTERQMLGGEGEVVRYFRHPEIKGVTACKHCGKTMNVHGWIDTLEGGHIVCPGDWVITGVAGEIYPCKPDIFAQTYEVASCTT